MTQYLPGTVCKIRGSSDDWVMIGSHHDGLVMKNIMQSRHTGEVRHVFNFEMTEKNSSTYTDTNLYLKEVSGIDFEELNGLFSNETDIFEIPFIENNEPIQPQPKRFKSASSMDIVKLKAQNTEKSTDSQTRWAVKLLKAWMVENNLNSEFEKMEEAQLNQVLENFYASLQSKKGQSYSKSALVGIRAGLNRHLTSPPHSRLINIMKDRGFMTSNQVFTGLIKVQKREGKDLSTHKTPISEEDHKLLYTCGIFDEDQPETLQNKIVYELIAQFGRRGREGLHLLKKESFIFKNDVKGREYMTMNFNEADKTHHGVNSKEIHKEPRMYATGDQYCPLSSFKKYLSKLNPKCDRLLQRPSKTKNSDNKIWYDNSPLGINKINNFMSKISETAKLSTRYTNHCIRAFVTTHLHRQGYSNEAIMSVTGHRNVQSLCSYIRPHDDEKQSVSNALSFKATSTSTNINHDRQLNDDMPPTGIPNEPLCPGPLELNVSSSQNVQNIHSTTNALHLAGREIHSLFSGTVNCGTININFYGHK